MRFTDKVVIVTGSGNGIGRTTALRFAREGASVIIADVDTAGAASVTQEIQSEGGSARQVTLDVTSRESVAAMVAQTVSEFGRVDVLCAIAGIGGSSPFLEISDERWDQMLAVNLKGVFLCGQEVARQMTKQGTGGKIVNMASTNGLVGEADLAHYNAAKFGVVGLTLSMAIDLAPHKINVNAVCPGLIETRLTRRFTTNPVASADYLKKIPLQRFGTTDDVAGCFLFFASDDANFITGTTLVVDGGQLTF